MIGLCFERDGGWKCLVPEKNDIHTYTWVRQDNGRVVD